MMGISYGGISQLFTAADQPAEPGRDLAALGDRRHADDALSGRHPQHRLRGGLGQGAHPRRQAGRPQGRAALGLQAHPGGRPDLQGQPGPARPGGRPDGQDPGQQPLRARRWPTRCRRSRSWTRSRCRPSWPASGRTSRPAGTARRWPRASPARTASGSRSPTAPMSTRSTRRRSTAGTTSSSSTSPSRRRSPTPRSIKAAGPVIYQAAMGISGVTMPRDPIQEEPTYESALAAFEKLPPVRILFDNGAGGSSPGQPLPAFEQSFSKFPIPGTTARIVVPRSRRRRAHATRSRLAREPTRSRGTPRPAR